MKDRITLLIKAKNLTAAQFADEIGVQKSSISHILSGRNNASLDFIQKILLTYPEVNMDWLMFGKGPIFKHIETALKSSNDESLNAVPTVDLTNVDLFSGLMPAKSSDFRKEIDLSDEEKSEENTNQEIKENGISAPLSKNIEQVPTEFTVSKKENGLVSSRHREADTKTLLKIVEFYSDNTYREFFPE
ncbi:MAG: helix-turn-helix transcriptional regulator [Bacteroidales bacterium]|nr:helix-turn-helix transcriptional regulator [Bacteroidales bacterium]